MSATEELDRELAELEGYLNEQAELPREDVDDETMWEDQPALEVVSKSEAVQTFIDPAQLKRDTAFSELTVGDAFMNQAALYVEYARLATKAKYQADRFESLAKIKEAEVYEKLRAKANKAGTKVTEAQLSKQALINPSVIAAKEKAIESQAIAELCKGALEALRQRRDMLIQTGADLREQRKGDVKTRLSPSERAKEAITQATA